MRTITINAEWSSTSIARRVEEALASGGEVVVPVPKHRRSAPRLRGAAARLFDDGVSSLLVTTPDGEEYRFFKKGDPSTWPVVGMIGGQAGSARFGGEPLETWTLHRQEGRTVDFTEAVPPA